MYDLIPIVASCFPKSKFIGKSEEKSPKKLSLGFKTDESHMSKENILFDASKEYYYPTFGSQKSSKSNNNVSLV